MTVKLSVILSGRTLDRYEFDDLERITIGRSQECEVTIDNLGVSRYHCEIERQGEVYRIRDTGSDNGTFVNEAEVKRIHNLNHGDTISVGKYMVRFEQTFVGEAPPVPKPTSGRMTAKQPFKRPVKAKSTGYLQFKDGKKTPLDKALFLIGKREDCDMQIGGWSNPGVVALIVRDDSGFLAIDVSSGGDVLRINGVRKRDARLNEDDLVIVSKLEFRFHRGVPVGG